MSTLAELQTQMNSEDPTVAIAAAKTLVNYYAIYNDEYNALVMKRREAETAVSVASRNPDGVNHAEVLNLEGLRLNIEARIAVQDGKMIVFRASGFSIAAPDAALVAQVRQLCEQVSAIAVKGEGIEAIALGLGQIAEVVNKVQSG